MKSLFPCPTDTDGDGNCHLCAHNPKGCSHKGFITEACRTESPTTPELLERLTKCVRVIHAIFGMLTELGELADVFKKHIFYGKPVDHVNVEEEMGDKFWYDAIFCDDQDLTFERVMELVIKKLRTRYPEKFTQEKAIVRNLATERECLEAGTTLQTVESMRTLAEETRWENPGMAAYEAYRDFSGGVSLVSGQPIPSWFELAGKIRDAWEAAARAVQALKPPTVTDDNGTPPDLR